MLQAVHDALVRAVGFGFQVAAHGLVRIFDEGNAEPAAHAGATAVTWADAPSGSVATVAAGSDLGAAAQPVRRAGAIVTEPAVAAAPMSCLLCMVLDLMRSGEGRSLTPSGR